MREEPTLHTDTDHFRRWIDEPSPLDLWVYRGQVARYETILPSITRPGARRYLGNRLHDVDPRTAHSLLTSSMVLRPPHLLPGLSGEMDLEREGFYSYVTERSGEASFSRIIRALAQHYGFPSLFVDVTLDPWVAAAFATYTRTQDGYVPRSEPGRVYRWPARRRGDTLLVAPGRRRAEQVLVAAGVTSGRHSPLTLDLIDLSRMSAHLRRPTNQSSVLALPVEVPSFNPETFSTPGVARVFPLREWDLDVLDLAQLPLVESIEVTPEQLEEPLSARGMSMDALFPDAIDLGYSYMGMVALLSLVTVHPEPEQELQDPEVDRWRTARQHAASIAAAEAILDRECFRLVPGTRLRSAYSRKLPLARQHLESQTQLALRATEHILAGDYADDARRQLDRVRRDLAFRMVSELLGPEVERNMRSALGEDQIPYFDYSTRSFVAVDLSMDSAGYDWIEGEIRRRATRAEAVARAASLLPAHALGDGDAGGLREVFPSDPEYEETVARQVAAVRRLRPDRAVFPGVDERRQA